MVTTFHFVKTEMEMRHLMASADYCNKFIMNGGDSMSKKRGGNRLKYQVEQSIKKINRIGVSKKMLRDENVETGIHSITQVKHALSVSQNFADWAKSEKGVKDLFQLKRSHYRAYLDFKKAEGVSTGHLINIETNLRLLEKGMNRISEEKGFPQRNWVPKVRLIATNSREKPQDRSYTPREIEGYLNKLSTNVRIGADLQAAFGLRLREVANTKVAHIEEKDGRFFWVALADKTVLNTAQGVTKAARGRETPCRPEYEQRVRELIQGKEKGQYVVPVRYNTLKSGYNRAGMKGSHAFRHTYAREMFRNELQSLGIEQKGRDMMQQILENRAAGYRKDHLVVTQDERLLYGNVSKVMDRIQSYLGHGDGRMDLAEIYLKGF